MKELFYKQHKLVAHPMTLVFPLGGAMLLIPNYPYTVCFFYVTLGIFFMFQNAREQRDNDFSALLPVRKADTVRCTVLYVAMVELMGIAVAAVFAVVSGVIQPNKNNLAGIDANAALIGIGFVAFAVFNGIFLPSFYRTGYKIGISFLKANIGMAFIVALDVALPHIFPFFDGGNAGQLVILVGGILIFAGVTWLSARKSVALFEKVDL